MPRFYHRRGTGAVPNGASATPPAIADLSLLALQPHLYPVYRDVPDKIAAQQGKPLPHGMPQRMMFSRWKSGGAQFASEAESYLSAKDYGPRFSGAVRDAAGLPAVMMSPASFATSNGATALYVQSIDPHIGDTPVSHGYLPPYRYETADELDAFVAAHNGAMIRARNTANAQQASALDEIHGINEAIDAQLGETPAQLPWWRR